MLASAVPERSVSKYKRLLGVNFVLTSAAAWAMAIPVAMAAPWIMRAYGSGFASGSTVLVCVSAATALAAMSTCVGQAIWSLDAALSGMLLALMRGVVLVLAAQSLARYGALGLALAHVITAIVQTAVSGPFMIQLLRRRAALWSAAGPPLAAPTLP
jgi:hypothetical protein